MLKSKNPEKAMLILDSIGKINRNSETLFFKFYLLRSLCSLKKNDEALNICNEVIYKNPKDSLLHEFYSLRSSIYKEFGELELAVQDINKAIALKPNEISYYLNASYYYGEISDYDNCLFVLDKAIALNPKDFYILNNLSYYSSLAKKYDKAISYANEGIKYVNDSTWLGVLINNRGFANLGLGKYEIALEDIDESIKYFPNNSYAYYNKALAYIQHKELNKVCENLNLAKQFGAINMTYDLLKQYCE